MTLQIHFPLNDNAASTTIGASTGSNGSLLGGDNTDAKAVSGPGRSITGGLDLNGTDDTVSFSTVTPSGAFTFSFWVKFDTVGTSQFLVGRSTTQAHRLQFSNATTLSCMISNSSVSFTVPALVTGAWYHIAIRRDGHKNRISCYLNGVHSPSGLQVLAGTPAFDRIGSGQSTNYLDGTIAQFKYFDSAENIAPLYAEGRRRRASFTKRTCTRTFSTR